MFDSIERNELVPALRQLTEQKKTSVQVIMTSGGTVGCTILDTFDTRLKVTSIGGNSRTPYAYIPYDKIAGLDLFSIKKRSSDASSGTGADAAVLFEKQIHNELIGIYNPEKRWITKDYRWKSGVQARTYDSPIKFTDSSKRYGRNVHYHEPFYSRHGKRNAKYKYNAPAIVSNKTVSEKNIRITPVKGTKLYVDWYYLSRMSGGGIRKIGFGPGLASKMFSGNVQVEVGYNLQEVYNRKLSNPVPFVRIGEFEDVAFTGYISFIYEKTKKGKLRLKRDNVDGENWIAAYVFNTKPEEGSDPARWHLVYFNEKYASLLKDYAGDTPREMTIYGEIIKSDVDCDLGEDSFYIMAICARAE